MKKMLFLHIFLLTLFCNAAKKETNEFKQLRNKLSQVSANQRNILKNILAKYDTTKKRTKQKRKKPNKTNKKKQKVAPKKDIPKTKTLPPTLKLRQDEAKSKRKHKQSRHKTIKETKPKKTRKRSPRSNAKPKTLRQASAFAKASADRQDRQNKPKKNNDIVKLKSKLSQGSANRKNILKNTLAKYERATLPSSPRLPLSPRLQRTGRKTGRQAPAVAKAMADRQDEAKGTRKRLPKTNIAPQTCIQTQCEENNRWAFTFKNGYFYPQECTWRKKFDCCDNNIGGYWLELAMRYNVWKSLHIEASGSYFKDDVFIVCLPHLTQIKMPTIGLGLKYFINQIDFSDDCNSWEDRCAFFFGGGLRVFFYNKKICPPFAPICIKKTAVGGMVSAGFQFKLYKRLFLDLFADYNIKKIHANCVDTCNPCNAPCGNCTQNCARDIHIGGLVAGIGIGCAF